MAGYSLEHHSLETDLDCVGQPKLICKTKQVYVSHTKPENKCVPTVFNINNVADKNIQRVSHICPIFHFHIT